MHTLPKVVSVLLAASALGGCPGITTAPSTAPAPNLPLPTLVNNVPNPDSARVALQSYCGFLGIINSDKSIESLWIPAFSGGTAPKLNVPDQAAQADYHSLLDKGASANLSAQYGPASGNFQLSGEDKLEVIINTNAFCIGPDLTPDIITAAAKQVDTLGYDRTKVVIIAQATLSEMSVNYLHSISANATAAATPIVNLGGSIFSKDTESKNTYYVALTTVALPAAIAAPPGHAVPVTPNPNVLPSPQPTPPSPFLLSLPLGTPSAAASVLSKVEFNTALTAASARQAIMVQRRSH